MGDDGSECAPMDRNLGDACGAEEVDLCPWKPWMALMDSHSRQSPEVHARQSFKVRDFLQCSSDRINCVGLVMSLSGPSDSFSTKGKGVKTQCGPCSFLKFGVLAQGSLFFF